jgi:predicted O-linked N-acetylglucosamine transferase (SPINDLY family)
MPFYLAYQGRNDLELQRLYGSLACRIMGDRYPPAPISGRAGPGERIRVGIVSAYFRHHSVWKMPIKGWLSQLDRGQFQIYGYHIGTERDRETELAASLCERFVQGPLSIDRWREEIVTDAPHVLIYPDIGMDGQSVQLAGQRLAPIQCNSWGHPVTSGMPTIDYYLSSDLMEPLDGQEHYTERLIRLPNLSVYYEPVEVKTIPRNWACAQPPRSSGAPSRYTNTCPSTIRSSPVSPANSAIASSCSCPIARAPRLPEFSNSVCAIHSPPSD